MACAAVPMDSTHILVVGGEDEEEILATTEVRPCLTEQYDHFGGCDNTSDLATTEILGAEEEQETRRR